MNWILKKTLFPIVKKMILKKLEDKEAVINYINSKIDMPKLSEEQEKEHLDNLYNLIIEIVKDYLG